MRLWRQEEQAQYRRTATSAAVEEIIVGNIVLVEVVEVVDTIPEGIIVLVQGNFALN